MKKSLKKVLCGLMAGLMVAVTVPAALPEAAYVTEVQAAARVATPKLVSAKASGKSKIVFKWQMEECGRSKRCKENSIF